MSIEAEFDPTGYLIFFGDKMNIHVSHEIYFYTYLGLYVFEWSFSSNALIFAVNVLLLHVGVYTTYKPFLNKDKAILKKLEQVCFQ